MDQKTQRYLQRIQKIMLTPKKSSTQYRPSKSPINCKTINLDKYIKYELSTKIIQNIIDRNNRSLLNHYFNAIRTVEYRQKERIYKFIAIEKAQNSREFLVESAVSMKILTAALKALVRRKYIQFINSLQEAAKSRPIVSKGSKIKIDRKTSAKEDSNYAVLMRTSTLPDKKNYKTVSEWIDGSSAMEESQNPKKPSLNIRDLALKSIFQIIGSKIKVCYLSTFCHIQRIINQNQYNQEQSQFHPDPIEQKVRPPLHIYQSAQFSYILVNIVKRQLSPALSMLKQARPLPRSIISQIYIMYERIDNIFSKHSFKSFHFFFNSIQQIKVEPKQQLLEIESAIKSHRDNKKSTKSDNSSVYPYNPLVKLNFYSFLDRMFKFMLIISKMLIVVKQAFIRIDHYASFAFRLEESLKVAPNRYLIDSFQLIKHYTGKSEKVEVDVAIKINKFCSLIMPNILEILIQGFTHIKIMSQRRLLKINLFPVKDTIIQNTKKFILDRESYKSLSYENWNELKSALLSPTAKASTIKTKRTSSNILV